MTIDIPSLNIQIREMGGKEAKEAQNRPILYEEAHALLERWAGHSGQLAALMKEIAARDSGIRCALPGVEPINARIPCPADCQKPAMLLGGDGSQITPDPQEEVLFGLINSAVILWPAEGERLAPLCQTHLLHHEHLLLPDGSLMDEGVFRLIRDVEERLFLLEHALAAPAPTVALIDGVLEPYQAPGGKTRSQPLYRQYLAAMERLYERKGAAAGYVDKPFSKTVLQMLELAEGTCEQSTTLRGFRRFAFLTDRTLFSRILQPGERSAVFHLLSLSSTALPEYLRTSMFYLNVGIRPTKPWVVRIEIPAWLETEKDLLGILHAALVAQCRIMANHYPYVLLRAHETCVIPREMAQLVKQQILAEYLRQGVSLEERSMKASLKEAVS